MRRERGPLVQVLAIGVVLVVLALVLAPTSHTASGPVVATTDLMADLHAPTWLQDTEAWGAFYNVLLFVPIGVVGALLLPHWGLRRWLLVGLVVSGAVELTQGFLLPGRDADPVDVLTNTVGTVVGAWIATRRAARSTTVGRSSR